MIHYLRRLEVAKVVIKRLKPHQLMLFMIRKIMYFPKNQRRGIFLFILITVAIASVIIASR